MAASMKLLWSPIPFAARVAFFAVLSVVLEVAVSYRRYAVVLRYLTLSLFALGIVGTGLLVLPVLAGSAAGGRRRSAQRHHGRRTGSQSGIFPPRSGERLA